MKYIKPLFAIMLAAAVLVGCGGAAKNASSEPSAPQSSVPVSSAESQPTNSSEPTDSTSSELVPNVQISGEYGDLLKEMNVSGEQLRAYGDLNSDYAAALESLDMILRDYNHNISLVAYSLDGKKAIGYNTDAQIFCACTVKAPYTLYCLMQMEKGAATLDTQMTYEKKHYEPGTGDMQYKPFGTVFDMRTMLHKSMSISDNVGYMMAVDYFGRDGYNQWVSSISAPSMQIKPTVWSLRANARDLAICWREIYKYFCRGGEYAEFLYNSCTGTDGNYSTQSLDVAYSHKQGHNRSGDWTSYSDAGIVWKEGAPYILAIITDAPGPSSYDAGVFADIAKIIHNDLF